MGIAKKYFYSLIIILFFSAGVKGNVVPDTTFLRISLHVIDNQQQNGNFHRDSAAHSLFLNDMLSWINSRMLNLDTLKPAVPSVYVKSLGIQLRTDSIFYHQDNYAWDCSEWIDSDYMRKVLVDQDSTLDYRQKYRTLPIFLGGNYSIVGGHNSQIGDKWFIAMRGMFEEYKTRPYHDAVRDCARGLLHELGHSLGLFHNFSGGPNGDQCDQCEDNSCPREGTSNNIMDYWPSYGYALSGCQKEIVWEHLSGLKGNISEIIWNDSCYIIHDKKVLVKDGERMLISDTTYLHSDLIVEKGGLLDVQSYLSIPGGCSIIIEPGASLLIENGTLGNLCGDLWNGLILMQEDSIARGNISIKNSLIENAIRGVSAEAYTDFFVSGTSFRNNLTALDLFESGGKTLITDCRFETDSRVNHWEEGKIPGSFIRVQNVKGVEIINCTFYNSEGHRGYSDKHSGVGIAAENSSISLENSYFDNLFKGVVGGGDEDNNYITVDSCGFRYCHCGIQFNSQYSAVVTSSSFLLNRLNTVPVYGIVVSDVSFLDLDSNTFYSDFGGNNLNGIVSDNTYPGTHLIRKNQFKLLENGLIVMRNEEEFMWPQDLVFSSYADVENEFLGAVWSQNDFESVDNELIYLNADGGGVLNSRPNLYNSFSVDWSRSYEGGGFGPYSSPGRLCIVKAGPDYGRESGSGFLFYILEYPGDSLRQKSPDGSSSEDVFNALVSVYMEGSEIYSEPAPATYAELLAAAGHLKKYPCLAFDERFRVFIDSHFPVLPAWFWGELNEALAGETPWMEGMQNLIVGLAEDQIRRSEREIPNSRTRILESFADTVFSVFNMKISTDIGRLNPGISSYSVSPSFIIAPNPVGDAIGVFFKGKLPKLDSDKGLDWWIKSLDGRILDHGRIIETGGLQIDHGGLSNGSYLLEIWDGNEFLGIQKFIILAN